MNRKTISLISLALVLLAQPAAMAGDGDTATTAEHMTALQQMCDGTENARTERQAAEALHDRLGGYDRILALTTEIVRLHDMNKDIKPMLETVDNAMLAKHVADFMAAGTGGTAEYTGRSMKASHAHLNLTDAHFLSAGADVIAAMKSLEYGQDEIDEVICILVSLKDQVVFK